MLLSSGIFCSLKAFPLPRCFQSHFLWNLMTWQIQLSPSCCCPTPGWLILEVFNFSKAFHCYRALFQQLWPWADESWVSRAFKYLYNPSAGDFQSNGGCSSWQMLLCVILTSKFSTYMPLTPWPEVMGWTSSTENQFQGNDFSRNSKASTGAFCQVGVCQIHLLIFTLDLLPAFKWILSFLCW